MIFPMLKYRMASCGVGIFLDSGRFQRSAKCAASHPKTSAYHHPNKPTVKPLQPLTQSPSTSGAILPYTTLEPTQDGLTYAASRKA